MPHRTTSSAPHGWVMRVSTYVSKADLGSCSIQSLPTAARRLPGWVPNDIPRCLVRSVTFQPLMQWSSLTITMIICPCRPYRKSIDFTQIATFSCPWATKSGSPTVASRIAPNSTGGTKSTSPCPRHKPAKVQAFPPPPPPQKRPLPPLSPRHATTSLHVSPACLANTSAPAPHSTAPTPSGPPGPSHPPPHPPPQISNPNPRKSISLATPVTGPSPSPQRAKTTGPMNTPNYHTARPLRTSDDSAAPSTWV